tara:strand:- start:1624 stop:2178 length:555 start_codon:yes stop_codon:yes gene_type:complete
MNIVIFRHGQTDWNVEGRLQGSTNIPLNNLGLSQAKELALRLSHISFDLIVSSDLDRAMETAKSLLEYQFCKVEADKRLREIGLGDAEGLTISEVKKKYNIDNFREFNFPGREDTSSIGTRVNQLIEELYNAGYEAVALSSHGGVVWNWLRLWTHEVQQVGNTDAFLLEWDGQKALYKERISNK